MNGKKISAHAVGAALAAIAVWAINTWSGIAVPAEIAVAFGTVAAVAVSFAVPDSLESDV
jgi:hypothetical protein